MPKRKLVTGEVARGSNGNLERVDGTFVNNLFGDTEDKHKGRLELGPTLIDIRNGLTQITQKNEGDKDLLKYTIMLYISRGLINNAVQFLNIESKIRDKGEIINVLFEYLKCKLPGGKRLNKRKKDGVFTARKYFGSDGDFKFLEIVNQQAYVYVGDADGKLYRNNFASAMDFIYRDDPENKPTLCSIM